MPAKQALQPRISARYNSVPAAKRVLMSIRGYDPLVQVLRLHEQNASVCTSRALAFCRSWPCLRNTLQPRISTRYSTAPTAKRVLMSIRGYDPLVQALGLSAQYTRYLH